MFWARQSAMPPSRVTDGLEFASRSWEALLEVICSFAPGFEFKYNKYYIGLAKDGHKMNFMASRARKKSLNVELKLPYTDDIQQRSEDAGIAVLEYDKKWRSYKLRLVKGDAGKHQVLLRELLEVRVKARTGDE